MKSKLLKTISILCASVMILPLIMPLKVSAGEPVSWLDCNGTEDALYVEYSSRDLTDKYGKLEFPNTWEVNGTIYMKKGNKTCTSGDISTNPNDKKWVAVPNDQIYKCSDICKYTSSSGKMEWYHTNGEYPSTFDYSDSEGYKGKLPRDMDVNSLTGWKVCDDYGNIKKPGDSDYAYWHRYSWYYYHRSTPDGSSLVDGQDYVTAGGGPKANNPSAEEIQYFEIGGYAGWAYKEVDSRVWKQIYEKASNKVSLTIEAKGNGKVTGGGVKELLDRKATFDGITATPNAGAQFKGWTVEFGDNVKPDTKGTVTISKNTKLVANFTGKHSLTVKSSEGGSAGDSCELEPGESKTLWKKANNGYAFLDWETSSKDLKINGDTITMPDHDVTITANFTKYSKLVNLSVAAYPSDAGIVTGGGNKILENGKAMFSNVTQRPNPNAPQGSHWEFDKWVVIKGDSVQPDSSNNITITKDTSIVANYRLVNDNPGIEKGDTSYLSVDASVDKPTVKEGQLVTFTINTHSNDYKYIEKKIGATEDDRDLRTWPNTHTPEYYIYPNGDSYNTYRENNDSSYRDGDGFKGKLGGWGERYWYYWDSNGYIYLYDYNQKYSGNVFRTPIPWFSAQKLKITFPYEITHSSDKGLNPALTNNLNNAPITPYLEWYIQSKPTYSDGYSPFEIIKNNTEKIEFYVPLTTPVTIKNDGTRIRRPYRIKIQAIETNGYITADTYVDLDVKGNIYEGIYTTPIG